MEVKLKDIIEEMEIQFVESHSLLNIKTGEIALVTSEDMRAVEDEKTFDHLPEWEQENKMIGTVAHEGCLTPRLLTIIIKIKNGSIRGY